MAIKGIRSSAVTTSKNHPFWSALPMLRGYQLNLSNLNFSVKKNSIKPFFNQGFTLKMVWQKLEWESGKIITKVVKIKKV